MRLFGLRLGGRTSTGPLTAEQVELACRVLLGRQATRAEFEQASAAKDLDALREILLRSEAAQRCVSPAAANADKKPLLLVGFPRGFTSQSYTIAQRATGLSEHFPSAGEFLNMQRLRAFYPFAATGKMIFYDTSEELYEQIKQAMDHVRDGYVVKDVVQPFHVLRYLDENPNKFNVVYVRRNLQHVAFSLMRREWGYVHRIGELHERFSKYTPMEVDKALEDIDHPVAVLRSLGYVARGYDYRDSGFLKRKQEFQDAFDSDHGKFDLDGLIANNDRRDVVPRFGAAHAEYVPPPPKPARERPKRPPGDRPKRERPAGERPNKDRPGRERPAGERPAKDRPANDRSAKESDMQEKGEARAAGSGRLG